MPSISIFIPMIPKAQKRDRITARNDFAKSYKDKTQRTNEDNLRAMIYKHMPTHVLWPLKTAIKLFLGIAMPVPSSESKKSKKAMISGLIRHIKKPDLDNLIKHLKDVGSGVMWQDDRQIDELHARKYYSDEPGWHIYLEW